MDILKTKTILMTFNFNQFLFSLVLSIFLFSCTSTEIPITEIEEKVTYDSHIKTIVNNSCATSACHDDTAPTGGLSLTNYSLVKNAAINGNFHTRIDNNTMPPNNPLSSATKSIINKWKTDGYLEN